MSKLHFIKQLAELGIANPERSALVCEIIERIVGETDPPDDSPCKVNHEECGPAICEAVCYVKRGKIPAIRMLRERTGLGLCEAKRQVEEMVEQLGLKPEWLPGGVPEMYT